MKSSEVQKPFSCFVKLINIRNGCGVQVLPRLLMYSLMTYGSAISETFAVMTDMSQPDRIFWKH